MTNNTPSDAWSDTNAFNLDREKFLGDMQRRYPRLYRTVCGTRYELPAYRQADYPHYAHAFGHDLSQVSLDGLVNMLLLSEQTGERLSSEDRDAVFATFYSLMIWIAQGKISAFVERELAEALLRTELPSDFVPEDICWKWNAFRLFLPTGLFRVESEYGPIEPTCVTAVRHFKERPMPMDVGLKADVRAYLKRRGALTPFEGIFDARSAENSLMLCMQMRPRPEFMGAADFYIAAVLDDRTLSEIAKDNQAYSPPREWAMAEEEFLRQIKRFVFNALLFTGQMPLEYQPGEVIRPFREKGGRIRSEIRKARFLGKELYRPQIRTDAGQDHEPTGRKLPGQWRAGHWRKQAFGPGRAQRRLQWIQPYRTHGTETP
jgi:hypothetical protein